MDDFKRFLEESAIAREVSLPTSVILRRLSLSPGTIADIAERVSFTPEGGVTCELEVGGLLVARGRIVRRQGKSWFKVTEIEEGGAR
jgi:hypothetical protein